MMYAAAAHTLCASRHAKWTYLLAAVLVQVIRFWAIHLMHVSIYPHVARWSLSGLVAAAAALQHRAQPPVLNLRDINPYVASAVGDYAKPSVNLAAAIPRGKCMLCWQPVCHVETAELPARVASTHLIYFLAHVVHTPCFHFWCVCYIA